MMLNLLLANSPWGRQRQSSLPYHATDPNSDKEKPSVREWYPVSPTLTQDGAFAAFSHLSNAKELKPIPLKTGHAEFDSALEDGRDVSMSFAVQLGIAGIGEGKTDWGGRQIYFDFGLYSQETTNTPNGGRIYGTRWGAGFRFGVSVSSLDASLDLKAFTIASAGAELNLLNASFQLYTFGVADPSFLAFIPKPGRFTPETADALQESEPKIRNWMANNKASLRSVPIQVQLDRPIEAELLLESASVLFAMRRIRDRKTFTQALAQAYNAHLDAFSIRSTYEEHVGGFTEQTVPSQGDADAADEWINIGS